ncbi:MAG: ferritin [Actinobacteria bacterium]|nr:ferritin [Actinomycetota bacterium]
MKVSDALEAAYSDQVTLELWASISYLQISAWFESKDLPGMASWMRIQRMVTRSIRNLYAMATEEKDAESFPLLDWFLTEQVEEEDSVQKIVGQLNLAGQDGSALLMLDRELGSRKPVAQ